MEISVKNITSGTAIEYVPLEGDFISKAIGLMFRRKGKIMMKFSFESRQGIWMMFMRFPIDIAFIDSDKCIVDIKHDVKPISMNPKSWKIYTPCRKCKYVLEVEAGHLNEKKFKVGDTLEF